MARPPNALSSELERWIYKERIGSILSVEFRPDEKKVLARWNAVAPVLQGSPEFRQRVADSKLKVYSTGCIVGEDEQGRTLILTCAHSLGLAFSSEKPITAYEAEQLYQAFVICDHREQRYERGEDPERIRTYASVAEISCEHDLLLLKVARGRMMHYCTEPHMPVPFSNMSVKALRRVVMLSWPCSRNRTAVCGHISHHGRAILDIAEGNPNGFVMRLVEVDIRSEAGSSGASCFDGWGDSVGVLHAGDGRFSYLIPSNVVRQTLALWGCAMYADE